MSKCLGYFFPMLILCLCLCGCGSPRNILVEVQAPIQVSNGDEFTIIAKVNNTAGKQQTLVSLDIADAYLTGIAIVRTEPEHSEATHVPLDNTMSYVFDLPIKAGEQREIRLFAKAIKQGDFNAEIDFCINSSMRFLSKSIRTVVQ